GDGSLCSLGYVLTDGFTILSQEDIVCNPPAKFRANIIGKDKKVDLAYDKSFFYSAPRFSVFYDKIKELFASCDLAVGFAVENDVKYLNDACRKFRLPLIDYRFFDVKQLLELFDDENKAKGLGAIAESLGVEFKAHRSDEDARATLIVLENLCEKQGLSLEGILEKTKMRYGYNSDKGWIHSYSEAQLYEQNGFKRTSKQSSVLFEHVLKKAEKSMKKDGAFRRKTFSISKEIRYADFGATAGFMKKIFSQGGKYSPCPTGANVFVYRDGEESKELACAKQLKKSNKKLLLLEEKEFYSFIGGFDRENIDAVAILRGKEIEDRVKRINQLRQQREDNKINKDKKEKL
ncbi:MAG: hypothetical protein MJ072_05350, partial [Clostridia bacterium]|nr:hypothetical protein [Clostridia bacterium]